ncbi:MAG: hypothetical protein ACR2NN_11350 [Bryobacteraceae bacterium]
MSKRLYVMCGVLLLGSWIASSQQGRSVQVQLNYTGSGSVDETHKIFVALWDSPGFTEGTATAPPIAVQSATSKNGTVTFSDVQKVPAYVSAAYDPTGHWDGQSGPPPSGASLGMYTKAPPKPEPIDMSPRKSVKVTITFDDTVKVP